MNGTEKNYKFGQKNNWRRRVWNEIARRVDAPRDALVLYLAGEQDLDRKVALEHGFLPDNLIIVEKLGPTAGKLRKRGNNAVHADIVDVVKGSPEEHPVAVVYGDICSGLEPRIYQIYRDICANPAFYDGVTAINLLRGRDPTSHPEREWARQAVVDESMSKHRGLIFLFRCDLELLSAMTRGEAAVYDGQGHITMHYPQTEKEWTLINGFYKWSDPFFSSYKSDSGHLVMDSVVFFSPLAGLSMKRGES